jgi:hypothetical protein
MKKEILVIAGRLAAFLVADGLLMGLTDPLKLPSIVIILGFLLVMGTVYEGLRLLLSAINSWLPLGADRIRRLALVCSGLATAILAMQSIGQLTVKDVGALLPLLVVLYFYFSYNAKRTPREN